MFQNKQEMGMKMKQWNSMNQIRKKARRERSGEEEKKGDEWVKKIQSWVEAVVSLAGL